MNLLQQSYWNCWNNTFQYFLWIRINSKTRKYCWVRHQIGIFGHTPSQGEKGHTSNCCRPEAEQKWTDKRGFTTHECPISNFYSSQPLFFFGRKQRNIVVDKKTKGRFPPRACSVSINRASEREAKLPLMALGNRQGEGEGGVIHPPGELVNWWAASKAAAKGCL